LQTSPTFGLVNEYETTNGSTIYHFDCYRMKSPAEAYDIGFEEYIDSGNICLIEWPEIIEEFLPLNYISINITLLPNGSRQFDIRVQS
jgi:tRNA threonylcarbamoyladenosine biosynthesis protein TsaE